MAIVIPIDADVSGLTRNLNGATSGLSRFGKMAAFAAGAAAFGGLVATVKIGIDEFMDSSKVTAQTEAVLRSTGRAAGVTKKHVEELAAAIEQKSTIDDEAIQSGENLLLTFTKVRNETGKGNDVFDQAVQVMADVSTAMGIDTSTAAIQLGKALNDPIRGVGQLRKVGVSFTEAQRDQIKTLVESGRAIDAQKMILRELQTEFGGSAEAAGKTLPGQLTILKNTFNNVAGDLVANFMPSIASAATAVLNFVRDISARDGFKAKLSFVFETAEQVASRFWTWWTQPTLKTVRSPTSGIHTEFTPPGSQQVAQWAQQLDAAVQARFNAWAKRLGYNIMDSLFTGAKDSAGEKGGDLMPWVIRLFSVQEQFRWSMDAGAQLLDHFWQGMKQWFASHPGVASKAIKDWLTGAGDALGGAAGDVWNSVSKALFRSAPSRGILDRPTIARVITDDMKAAIQSARTGLASAASGLVGMLNQIIAVRGTNPAADLAAARSLEDRRLALQEDSLKAALAATEDGSAEQAQAKLDLDQFYFDKAATLRQRTVEDEQKANQTAIEDLATRFNQGLIDATSFSQQLDAIIGGETGASLGQSFSVNFINALQSIKNAAADIFNVVGTGSPIGPDIAAGMGPVTAAAQGAYDDALAKWQDRRDKLNDRLRTLRDKANDKDSPGGKKITKSEQDAIDDAQDALKRHMASKPKKADYGLAAGGILTGPRYLAGEAGNEAVIPLGSPTAADMMRKAFASAVTGGDTIYNISVNAGVGTDANELGRVVVQAIKTYERKNGPVFQSA